MFPYDQTILQTDFQHNFALFGRSAFMALTISNTSTVSRSISENVFPCPATALSVSPTSSFGSLYYIDMTFTAYLFFFSSICPYFTPFWCLCHLSHPHISVCLFYLYPIIPSFCSLADLNPVLFWSSALGETNSLWLSAGTHILSCPSALTVRMRTTLRKGGGGGAKGGRERWKKRCAVRSIVR